VFRESAEADQCALLQAWPKVQRRQWGDVDALGGGCLGEGDVIGVRGERKEQLHPRSGAEDLQPGELRCQRAHEEVAAAPVGAAGSSDVPFVLTGCQEPTRVSWSRAGDQSRLRTCVPLAGQRVRRGALIQPTRTHR
jgi:hypothetical protein